MFSPTGEYVACSLSSSLSPNGLRFSVASVRWKRVLGSLHSSLDFVSLFKIVSCAEQLDILCP